MDHFESIVAMLLEAEGYWVRRSFKVNVTPEEKRAIGKPSIPRPEIDLLAHHFQRNEVIAVEAKSYFDSQGVKLADLLEVHDVPEGRYKLFTSERYRSIVLQRLHQDLMERGMANAQTTIRLGLAAGNVYQAQEAAVRATMDAQDWFFWSPTDIKNKVQAQARRGYENDAAVITAKILMR
jgi:hypothetical protein